MSQLRLGAVTPGPTLYDAIQFNPNLEALAFRRLADSDAEGCRAAFALLIDRIETGSGGPRERQVVLLLLELLQQVNRRLRAMSDHELFQSCRLELLERYSRYDTIEQARRDFLPALDRLLASLAPRSAACRPLVIRAQAHIQENYSRKLSLSVVASALRVGPAHLSRVFRRETGTTLTCHLHRVRLEHALLLLAAGGRSLSEVAYMVGYRNYRDFYRNFIKHEKASPRQAWVGIAGTSVVPRSPRSGPTPKERPRVSATSSE